MLFDRVEFEVIGPLSTTSQGNRFILTMIDYFSRCAEAYALPNHKAETVADCMLVTGKETNMPVELIYGSPNSRRNSIITIAIVVRLRIFKI